MRPDAVSINQSVGAYAGGHALPRPPYNAKPRGPSRRISVQAPFLALITVLWTRTTIRCQYLHRSMDQTIQSLVLRVQLHENQEDIHIAYGLRKSYHKVLWMGRRPAWWPATREPMGGHHGVRKVTCFPGICPTWWTDSCCTKWMQRGLVSTSTSNSRC